MRGLGGKGKGAGTTEGLSKIQLEARSWKKRREGKERNGRIMTDFTKRTGQGGAATWWKNSAPGGHRFWGGNEERKGLRSARGAWGGEGPL